MSSATEPDTAVDHAVVWHDAPELADLWEGDLTDLAIDDTEVLVVRLLGGELKAYQGLCPHQEIALVDGEWDEDRATLVCHGHHWEFDLRSGAGINPSGCQLYEFPIDTVDGVVRVGIPEDGSRHYNRFSES